MRLRKRLDGSLMDVGCEFVIAACEPGDAFAEIWQIADPLETATVHVSRAWNPRSIGIERCMPGTRKQAERLGSKRPITSRRVAGVKLEVTEFYPGEVASFLWLIELLSSELEIPRRVPATPAGALLRGRMTALEAKRVRGLVEHYHSPSTTKYDTGTLACEQALAAGWGLVAP